MPNENAEEMEATEAPPPAKWRLFLGLWPTDALRGAMQDLSEAWQWPASARRTSREKLHITLHFLGDVDAARIPELQHGLQVPWNGCDLLLDRAAVWPGGIAVLEASEVPPELADFHAALAERLLMLQLPVDERRYRPHVTLARKAKGARPPQGHAALRWHAGPGYVLMRSVPGGGYESLQCFG